MQRERITDHIFVFRSEQYAQVTAGLVLTPAGAVLIDTLLYPEETLRIRRYVERGLKLTVRYVILSHFHADHSTGLCFFPEAQVIAHESCCAMLDTRGRESLRRMQANAAEFAPVKVVLPDITFADEMRLTLGGLNFKLWASPGHSPDSIVCLIEDEEILFAADTVMPIPYFVDGDCADFERSLRRLLADEYENVVQGHGEIILRGEVSEKITSDLAYLECLQAAVQHELARGQAGIEERISVTDCGKSRVLLRGLVQDLHRGNVRALVKQFSSGSMAEEDTEK